MKQRSNGDLGHPVRVLHIEDTDLTAKVVADTLAKEAVGTYDVHRAVSQAKGLAYAREHEVDVVLLDLGLPDTRGPEGVRTLRAALPHVPVVVLSADDDPETRLRVYEAGAVAFLDKADMRATALEACLRAAVANSRFRQRVRSTVEAKQAAQCLTTVSMLIRTLHMHHPTTVEHSLRVAEIAHATACRMGLSETHAAALRAAGMLHDIGKIMLSPAGILDSKDSLSERDWDRIREHSLAGYDILASVEWPWPVADIVFQHHERMDGTGYPAGRQGDAIMLEARILAVADAFDARAHRRDRSNESGIDAALAHLRDGSGTLYDAGVVDACCAIFDKPVASAAPGAAPVSPARRSLLLIDDEPAMGRSIQRALLGLKDVVVTFATDGAYGLEMARRTTPDMIFLDIRMPGMDGIQVLRELKTASETKSIPVVMLTGVDDRETIRAALVGGAEDYLTKPVRPDWLHETVAQRLTPAARAQG